MGDAYQYYHKVEGNVHYFAKLENQDGILIVMDYSTELVINTISTLTEDIAKNSLRMIFYKDEN